MQLSSLFEGAPKTEIKSLMSDSRIKSNKALFFCLKGLVTDGHRFVSQAKENGAIAVVYSDEFEYYDPELIYIKVNDVLETLNQIAARFYHYCTKRMTVFGTTGTNGKSTIAWVTKYLVNHFEPTGYIGTIAIIYGDQIKEEHLTTPEVIYLHQTMYDMYKAGMKAVSLEVSSQGLDMHRCDSIDFNCAIFTNLTHEHLDYHLTFENYYQAKLRLFKMLGEKAPAVINVDDPYGVRLVKDTTGRPVTYSLNNPADYQAKKIQLFADHTEFVLMTKDSQYPVKTNLLAMFNVYNLVASLVAVHETLGYSFEELIPLCENIPQVWGRVEKINEGQNFNVFVDYAHTPDGIEKLMTFIRTITPPDKRIIAVFGSAGGRDTKKRPTMGMVADKYCNIIILTSEDPRMENPEEIAKQIQKGIKNNTSMIIVDRYEAIRQGIELANEGDTVVILGKGDETFNAVKGIQTPWMSDPLAAKSAIAQYKSEQED